MMLDKLRLMSINVLKGQAKKINENSNTELKTIKLIFLKICLEIKFIRSAVLKTRTLLRDQPDLLLKSIPKTKPINEVSMLLSVSVKQKIIKKKLSEVI